MVDQQRETGGQACAPGIAGTRFLRAFGNIEDRQAVAALTLPTRIWRASVDFVREGGATDRLYVLVEGWACRYKATREGGRQIVALLTPGDVVNLDTLLAGRPDFSVRSLTTVEVVPLPCDAMLALAAHRAGVGGALTRLALVENAILSQWALCLGRMSAQQRLAHLFCELRERLRPGEDDASRFDLPLTQEQIGDTLGLTAVHVNRTLQRLRGDGLVEFAGRLLRFRDPKRLRDLAGFNPAYLHGGDVGVGTRPVAA